MGGIWERMIGMVRRILDSMLLGSTGDTLTHDVLNTFTMKLVPRSDRNILASPLIAVNRLTALMNAEELISSTSSI
jgi:hypothetical protein